MNHKLTRQLKTSAGNIAWDVTGAGPDVVLVHGTPANSVIWSWVINRLSDRYKLHYLDLPGYGASDKFKGQDVRLRTLAVAFAEFVDHLGLEAPHVVGHDFGAAIVLGAHLIEKTPFASICVADGVVLGPWGTTYSRHVNAHEEVFAAIPDYIHRATLSAHLATAVARPMSADLESALIEPWTGEIGQPAYYRNVGQFDYTYTDELEVLYPDLELPVQILWGEQDHWIEPSEAQRFRQLISHAELNMLPDAGHFSMLDCPGLFARELDGFLAERAA